MAARQTNQKRAHGMTTVDKLLNGASLRVVLHPNPEIHTTFPDLIESFALPHVVIEGEHFIGKSRGHGLPYNYQELNAFDPGFAASYAYANYVNLVVNCSLTGNFIRIFDTGVYLDVTFQTISNYEMIWKHGRDMPIAAVEGAVRDGRMLRVALQDPDGFWNIHPVDMSSFYVGRNSFELFTEQDSIPLLFRFPSMFREIEKKRLDQIVAAGHDPSSKTGLSFGIHANPTEFYSVYYTVRSNGEYLRGAYVGIDEKPQRYAGLKVFAEKW
jgi:hypothetical protein